MSLVTLPVDSAETLSLETTRNPKNCNQMDQNLILNNCNQTQDSVKQELKHNLNNLVLDNRFIEPLELAIASESESLMYERQNISRTLADNHPLMSPSFTDSDSEFDQHLPQNILNNANKIKNKMYPDVVPSGETKNIRSAPQVTVVEKTLNSINISCDKTALSTHNLKPVPLKGTEFRSSSPDLISSGSEFNASQYQANVDANNQTVSLIPNKRGAQNKNFNNSKKPEDISSLDSISNHSFEGDEEHNLASLSPSSSIIDGLDDDDDDDGDDCGGSEMMHDLDIDINHVAITPTPTAENSILLPQYSASEERRDSRNWQKITLPDGQTRDIDMRVIEPYKRILSHGGYLKAGGQNAIVIFCACHLPDRSRKDYSYVMDNLFLYVVKTLETLVTDDYVLIWLHGGSSRRNMPPFPWLKRCYQLLDRRLRKSLKNMYLVHPTFWIKSIVWMARPFVSTKFWRKLVYVKSLEQLSEYVTALETTAIPEKVKQYDAKMH